MARISGPANIMPLKTVKKQAFMVAGERSNGVTNEARDNVFDYIGRLHDYRKRIRGGAQDLKLSSCKHPRFSTCL